MLASDLVQETFFSLLANKSRSFLTILGIVIGIASVITMISVGQGASKDIQDKIQSLGSNLLMIMPGSSSGPTTLVKSSSGSANTLTIDDAEAIEEKVSSVQLIAPSVNTKQQVIAKGTNINTMIYGIDENYFSVKNIDLETGQPISIQNISRMSKIVVLGPATATDLFGENYDPIGQAVRIAGQQYTVIGTTEAKGSSGMSSSDDAIYAPLSTVQHYITGNDHLNNIDIQITEADLMDESQENINSLLLSLHGKTEETADFRIMNQADIMETMSSIIGTMTLLLGSIAGISLVVGGIGIMNMMLTIVTERTREIGLRKSLGAKERDINLQFLAEAIALTFLGGIVGIILGASASAMINNLGIMTTVVTPSSIFLAFGVSTTIGLVFGYYPAKRAAKLNPIDALRYE